MKVTNTTGLPQAIVDAVKNDSYSRGSADISVTELIGPPRKAALEHKHWDEMTEDASSRIWALMGQSIHTILERANRAGIAERRLSIDVEGWVLSGGMDLYDEDGILVDYKTCSAWSCKGGVKDEWEKQLNVYAEILRRYDYPVTGLKIVAILRDWSKLEAARDAEYPQSQVVSFQVELWQGERAKNYVRERVILHKQARVSLPQCSDAERWAKPDTWAVMKHGAARAVRVFESRTEAETYAERNKDYVVVARQGESTRCRFYCSVAQFCSQHQDSLRLSLNTESA